MIEKLGKYVTIKTGKLDVNASTKSGKYPFFTCARNISRIDTYSFEGKSVLVAGNGDLNVKYYDGKFDAYQRTYVIQSINSNNLYSKYLYHFLSNYITVLRDQSIGGVIKYIKLNNLTDAKIPLPPLETQQKIAAILDKADELVQNDKKILEKYDQLARSVFLEMFGDPEKNKKEWSKAKLGDVISYPNGLIDPRIEPYTDMFHVGGDNILSNSGKIINLRKANELNLISGKFLFNDEYILYNKIRPYLNKVAKPEFTGICSADMYPIKPNLEIINRDFLIFVLRSRSFLDYAGRQSRRANIPKINKSEMSNYMIITPPILLQNRFAEIIKHIETQKQVARQSLEKSEELFLSLLQGVFRASDGNEGEGWD